MQSLHWIFPRPTRTRTKSDRWTIVSPQRSSFWHHQQFTIIQQVLSSACPDIRLYTPLFIMSLDFKISLVGYQHQVTSINIMICVVKELAILTSYLAHCSQRLAILSFIGPMTSPEDGCTAWDAISRWRYDSGRVARWKVSSHLYIGLSFFMPAPINPKTYYYGYANSSGFPNRPPSHFL